MNRFDSNRPKRSASYKDVSSYKAAWRDAQDVADLRDRRTVRWDYASPEALGEIDDYVEALLVARH